MKQPDTDAQLPESLRSEVYSWQAMVEFLSKIYQSIAQSEPLDVQELKGAAGYVDCFDGITVTNGKMTIRVTYYLA